MSTATITSDEVQRELDENGRWLDHVTKAEIAELRRMNDTRSWLTLAFNWGVVFGSMALVAAWPNPLTIVLALFLIGARQLGNAVMMHDASHHALLSDRRLNDWAGNWLGGYPVWSDMHSYRPYHLTHHRHTWTDKDPDVGLARPFPITPASFRRKVWRDLSGQTGLKFVKFAIRRDFGSEGTWGERTRRALASQRFRGMLISNAVILGIASLIGHPALYLLWLGAYMTTNTLVTRIRAIAEHSMVPDPADPLRNTRTTLARWWERLFIAPNRVNYHLEHHLVMTVPHYNLPKMHALLAERGVLDQALVARGYASVLRGATSKAAGA
jgi:fatty acid desaturase